MATSGKKRDGASSSGYKFQIQENFQTIIVRVVGGAETLVRRA